MRHKSFTQKINVSGIVKRIDIKKDDMETFDTVTISFQMKRAIKQKMQFFLDLTVIQKDKWKFNQFHDKTPFVSSDRIGQIGKEASKSVSSGNAQIGLSENEQNATWKNGIEPLFENQTMVQSPYVSIHQHDSLIYCGRKYFGT